MNPSSAREVSFRNHYAVVFFPEPICAVGYGVAALFSAKNENKKSFWSFKNYSLTAVSLPKYPWL